jgi:large subunit ribosomal protein L16
MLVIKFLDLNFKNMLIPKRLKFRRQHRVKLSNVKSKVKIVFGDFGLQALEPSWLTSRQIEATRRVITRYVRRVGKIWIRVFPDKPITERAAESRMGSGKGTVSYWVAVVNKNTMIFEINGLNKSRSHFVLNLASHKLPLKTCVVSK